VFIDGVLTEVERGRPEGVILQTSAPREAVVLIRKPEDYYDEGEVVVDPFRLGKVKVVARFIPQITEAKRNTRPPTRA